MKSRCSCGTDVPPLEHHPQCPEYIEQQPDPPATTDEDVQNAIDKLAVAIGHDLEVNGDPKILGISLITQVRICGIFQRLITDALDKAGVISEAKIRDLLVAEVLKEAEELRGTIAMAPADALKGKRHS